MLKPLVLLARRSLNRDFHFGVQWLACDIFISYARSDADAARRFADAFAHEGFDVWWDDDLRTGEVWDEAIEAALRAARAVVVLWSPRSVGSRWVRAEATIGDRNGTLVPVEIEHCQKPVIFELTQTADLSGWQGGGDDKAWKGLLGRVRELVGKGAAQAPAPPAAAPASAAGSAESGVPLIALLPLTARGDGELELFAEDLTDELTLELARDKLYRFAAAGMMARYRGQNADYRAVGKELGANYLLEGKLQRAGANLRLSMQLIDADKANVLWSGRYTEPADDPEAALREFAIKVTGQLLETIFHCECDRASARTGNLSAWDHCMRSVRLFGRPGSHAVVRILEDARMCVAKAPELAMGQAMLAQTLDLARYYPGALDPPDEAELRECIKLAMEFGGDSAMVLRQLSSPMSALGETQAGLQLVERSVALSPRSAHGHCMRAVALFRLGRLEEAVAEFAEDQRLAPNNGLSFYTHSFTATAHLLTGDLEAAQIDIDRSLAIHPTFLFGLLLGAVIAEKRGAHAAALAATRRARESEPAMTSEDHLAGVEQILVNRDAVAELQATLRGLLEDTAA